MVLFTGHSKKMLSPEILFICFGAVFGLSWAGIPYKDMEKAKVFDKSSTNYEAELYNAFSLSADTPGRNLAVAVGSTAPVAGPAVPILNEVLKLVNPGSEWQRVVAATIDDTTDKKKFDGRVEDIKVQLRSIQTSLKNSRGADIKTVYWDTNKDFETLLNYFAEHKSILKKYPLVSSPILLDLVRFVAKLNVGINDHDMSCKIRNILLEYRRRSVDARLDKITTKWDKEFLHILYSVYSKNYDSPLIRSATFSRPYKKEGYGYDKPSEISCEKVPKHSLSGIKRYVMIDEFDDKFNYNVLDEDYYKSGSDNVYNYAFNDVGSYTRNPSTAVKCAMDYFGFIRYSVEQMFPVEMFEELAGKCGVNDSQVPSGKLTNSLQMKCTLTTDSSCRYGLSYAQIQTRQFTKGEWWRRTGTTWR